MSRETMVRRFIVYGMELNERWGRWVDDSDDGNEDGMMPAGMERSSLYGKWVDRRPSQSFFGDLPVASEANARAAVPIERPSPFATSLRSASAGLLRPASSGLMQPGLDSGLSFDSSLRNLNSSAKSWSGIDHYHTWSSPFPSQHAQPPPFEDARLPSGANWHTAKSHGLTTSALRKRQGVSAAPAWGERSLITRIPQPKEELPSHTRAHIELVLGRTRYIGRIGRVSRAGPGTMLSTTGY